MLSSIYRNRKAGIFDGVTKILHHLRSSFSVRPNTLTSFSLGEQEEHLLPQPFRSNCIENWKMPRFGPSLEEIEADGRDYWINTTYESQTCLDVCQLLDTHHHCGCYWEEFDTFQIRLHKSDRDKTYPVVLQPHCSIKNIPHQYLPCRCAMKATTHAWKHHGKGLPNSSMISHGRKSVPVIARRAAGHLATISSNRPRSGLPLTIGGKLPRASTFLFLQSSILQMIWAPSWRATVLRTT